MHRSSPLSLPYVRFLFFLSLVLSVASPKAFAAQPAGPTPNRAPLKPNAFERLPLTSVKPKGWLLRQLQIQANGLSGHIDEFWPDLGSNSGWLGGTGESWERGAYFMDGLVPLAYLTDDARLIAKAQKWIGWTLAHPQPDGWIGPAKNTDWWPNYVLLKALTQYQEATGDSRVIPLMEKYFAFQAKHLSERPLKEWAIYRWHDEVLSILWLYNRTGDKRLLDLARQLQTQGHNWQAQFADYPFRDKVDKAKITLATHGVNNAMGVKAGAVWWLIAGDPKDQANSAQALAALDRFHGQPSGVFAADEHLAGRDPTQGAELCTVVEEMFSLETTLSILGDPAFGDRLEKIAYNALPGTFSADMWAHQFDQQANQVISSLANRRWTINFPDSNTFGLEPNYGCCTANFHQGWPKFAASLWMGTPDHGLAAVAYAPSEVSTTVGDGVPVTVSEDTDYPFRETVTLFVKAAHEVKFPLVLRIPAWAGGATVAVNGVPIEGVTPGRFFRLERQWKSGDRVELRFPMRVETAPGFDNSLAVQRGPLVYSLKIGESWHKLKQTGPAPDWEVYPTTPWNYALVVDQSEPARSFAVTELPVGDQPFSVDSPPVEIQAKARRLTEWQIEDDSAGPPPVSPVTSKLPVETIFLIPYGAAKLRITDFPYMPE